MDILYLQEDNTLLPKIYTDRRVLVRTLQLYAPFNLVRKLMFSHYTIKLQIPFFVEYYQPYNLILKIKKDADEVGDYGNI